MTSVTLTETERVAGFFAYTCVITVITPLGDAASFVQVTLIATDLLNAPAGSHVLVKLSATGVGALTMSQTWSLSWVAVISFDSSCGAISLTLIEIFLSPMPCEPRFSLSRFACNDDPGLACEPR